MLSFVVACRISVVRICDGLAYSSFMYFSQGCNYYALTDKTVVTIDVLVKVFLNVLNIVITLCKLWPY